MTSFRVTGRSSEEEYGVLRDQSAMHVKHATEGFSAGADGTVNGAVRLAPHYFATDDEIARVLSAIHRIAGV